MNRKALSLAITLLFVTIVATSMMSTVQSCRPRCDALPLVAYNRMSDPTTDPPGYTIPPDTMYFGPKIAELVTPANPEGHKYMLMKGGVIFGVLDCDPLGTGTMTNSRVCHFVNMETGEGFGLYIMLWEFNNDVCVGSIKGVIRTQTSTVFPNIVVSAEPKLIWGTGDLAGAKVVCCYNALSNLITGMAEGESVGTLWNWSP